MDVQVGVIWMLCMIKGPSDELSLVLVRKKRRENDQAWPKGQRSYGWMGGMSAPGKLWRATASRPAGMQDRASGLPSHRPEETSCSLAGSARARSRTVWRSGDRDLSLNFFSAARKGVDMEDNRAKQEAE